MTRSLLALLLMLGMPPAGLTQATDAANDLDALHANAERGNAASQYALGLRYANGAGGVERDPIEALRWYRLSGEQGHMPAQFAVAAMYDRGIGTEADPSEAARWYEAAALQGHAGAQHNLAAAYEGGRGVGRNLELAREWYLSAAQAGLPVSQIRLAEMLEDGIGGDVNPVGAAEWYQVAAVQGDVVGQARLGLMFAEGRGIDRNDNGGFLWLEIVTRRGVEEPEVVAARNAAAARLTPETRARLTASTEGCELAAFYYCGEPVAPPCALNDAHRSVSPVLEAGTMPDIVRPTLVQSVQPQFPVQALAARGRPGTAVLDALLLSDGSVGPLCVRESLGPVLDAAAVAAAAQWLFQPATRSGEPVAVWVRLELSVQAAPDVPVQ